MVTHMIYGVLAHAGGLDEMAIILFPVLVGGGVWALTRTPGSKKPKAPPATPTGRKPNTPVFRPPDGKTKPPTFG